MELSTNCYDITLFGVFHTIVCLPCLQRRIKCQGINVTKRIDTELAVDDIIASVGIQMMLLSQSLDETPDCVYGEDWHDKTATMTYLWSVVLHEVLAQHREYLHLLMTVLPDGIGTQRVSNPLAEKYKAEHSDKPSDLAEGNDDLFPF